MTDETTFSLDTTCRTCLQQNGEQNVQLVSLFPSPLRENGSRMLLLNELLFMNLKVILL